MAVKFTPVMLICCNAAPPPAFVESHRYTVQALQLCPRVRLPLIVAVCPGLTGLGLTVGTAAVTARTVTDA